MADNIIIPETITGKTVSTEDLSGVHIQRVKMTLGDNGVDDGTVSQANPVPVDPIADQEGENHDWHVTEVVEVVKPEPLFSGIPFYANADVDYLVLAAKGNITNLWVINKSTSLLFVQIHNKTSVPTSGNVPLKVLPLPAGASAAIPYVGAFGQDYLGKNGIHCDTGMAIGISSTLATFTAHGTASEVALGGLYST